MLRVQHDELFYACMVDKQAIVIPETIDAALGVETELVSAAMSDATTHATPER